MEVGIQLYTTAQLVGVSISCPGSHYSDECIGVRFRYAAPHPHASETKSGSEPKYGGWSTEVSDHYPIWVEM